MIQNLHLLPKVRSAALMSAIRGMPCALRLSTFLGEPCASVETVVGAHVGGSGKGMSTKVSDLCVVAACAKCHALLDRVDPRGMAIRDRYPAAFHEQVLRGLAETHARLVGLGIIIVEGGEVL